MSKKGNRARKNKRSLLTIIIALAVIIIAGALIFTFYLKEGDKPVNPNDTQSVAVAIPVGSGTEGIGTILAEKGLIESVGVFKLQSKIKGYDGKYKAGEFVLSPSMSMDEMMQIIISGNSATQRFTIPEGYDIKKTTEKLSTEGLINAEIFAKEIELGIFDYQFLKDAPPGANRLEGYLFPETYDIFTTAKEHDIIDRMLAQFDVVFTEEYYNRASELGLSINQVVTIASLIERETRVDKERELVSSVIQNRLTIGMPLQIDATVQYALGEQKDRLSLKDLEVNSPYNTYKINGIPPGPICSPGSESIKAALYPATTDYLYYVLKPALDGSHNFAKTYDEFLSYKRQYINAL